MRYIFKIHIKKNGVSTLNNQTFDLLYSKKNGQLQVCLCRKYIHVSLKIFVERGYPTLFFSAII